MVFGIRLFLSLALSPEEEIGFLRVTTYYSFKSRAKVARALAGRSYCQPRRAGKNREA